MHNAFLHAVALVTASHQFEQVHFRCLWCGMPKTWHWMCVVITALCLASHQQRGIAVSLLCFSETERHVRAATRDGHQRRRLDFMCAQSLQSLPQSKLLCPSLATKSADSCPSAALRCLSFCPLFFFLSIPLFPCLFMLFLLS